MRFLRSSMFLLVMPHAAIRTDAPIIPGLDVVDAISKLSTAAVLALVVVLILTRRFRTDGEMNDRDVLQGKFSDELKQERDSWRAIAEGLLPKVDSLASGVNKSNEITERLLNEIRSQQGRNKVQ